MKTKIGILCFWGVPNYGAWAQAYALNSIVKQILGDGYIVEHINYLHPKHFESYYKDDEKLNNNFTYSYNEIPHTRYLTSEELEVEEFDIVITGSDAIWEFSINVFGDDRHLIGNNINTKKLIAYAPSFGTMSLDAEYKTWVKEGLKKYNSLSVRDANSANIVKNLIGIKPQVVLDPVLLWNFNDDNNVLIPVMDSYILVYGINWTKEFIEMAKVYAKNKKCKLISVGYINSWCDISFRMIELRGFEWLGLFKNATCIITSMFHGLMLSLVFKKQVKFYFAPYVQKRSETLLKELGMDIFLSGDDVVEEIFTSNIDFEQVDIKLQQLRTKSLKYLKQSLLEIT